MMQHVVFANTAAALRRHLAGTPLEGDEEVLRSGAILLQDIRGDNPVHFADCRTRTRRQFAVINARGEINGLPRSDRRLYRTFGDIVRNVRRVANGQKVTDDLVKIAEFYDLAARKLAPLTTPMPLTNSISHAA